MNTEIVKVDESLIDSEPYRSALLRAAEIIRSGGLVVFPTETVYGLGADGTNPAAAAKIYEAKGRPSDNPLIIHISNPNEADKYAVTSELYYRLAEKFMPGPLTVVMRAKDSVPMATRGGLDTVAVRCPAAAIANRLIALSGAPVAAPSANISGSPSPTVASHVIDDMLGRVDMIIDGGECDIGLESTIVKIEDDGTLALLRPGKITPDELLCIADLKMANAVTEKLRDGEVAVSPGMKYRHYAPKAPLVLIDGECDAAIRYITSENLVRVAVLCYRDDESVLRKSLPNVALYVLGEREDEGEQARHLFYLLREADKCKYDKIYAPLPSKTGMGLALYNRLIRAAAHTIINLRR